MKKKLRKQPDYIKNDCEILMNLIETNNKKLYTCDVCGKVENWTALWSWYGSYKDQKDGNITKVQKLDQCINK